MSTLGTDLRVLVVHESMFGNTAGIATAITEALRHDGVDAETVDVGHAPPLHEVTADLLVLGAPTHAFSLSRDSTRADAVRQGAAEHTGPGLREWLEAGRTHPARWPIPTACFDTRVAKVRRLPGSAARKADRLARSAGLRQAAGPESFYVEDVAGPLLAGELERATQWARAVASRLPERT
jgi:hypothetical protein